MDITLEAIPDAIVIPTGALIPELNGAKVFVRESGTAKSVRVETGLRTDREIQITSGLHAGDTLIVTGLLQLSDGKKVQFRESRIS